MTRSVALRDATLRLAELAPLRVVELGCLACWGAHNQLHARNCFGARHIAAKIADRRGDAVPQVAIRDR
jgi:hypothetical protein